MATSPQSKERPILFSAPMVRAILEGRKTVTRRPVKTDWIQSDRAPLNTAPGLFHFWCSGEHVCPYGEPGQRLWVRETFMDLLGTGVEHRPDPNGPLQRYAYRADYPPGSHSDEARKDFGLKWKPSIHMPRAASRILLEITGVRVERLQEISEEQALAEGIIPHVRGGWHWHLHDPINIDDWHQFGFKSPAFAFQDIWIGTGGDWDANPWVWVVEFRRVQP